MRRLALKAFVVTLVSGGVIVLALALWKHYAVLAGAILALLWVAVPRAIDQVQQATGGEAHGPSSASGQRTSSSGSFHAGTAASCATRGS